MQPTRISIAGVMGLVLVAALGAAGLREGTPIWAIAMFTLMVAFLLGAILNAVYSRGPTRAYWVGFALFGWTYAALNFGPLAADGTRVPPLATGPMLDALLARAHPAPEYEPDPNDPQATTIFTGTVTYSGPRMRLKAGSVAWGGSPEYFRQVGHALGALVFGVLGGLWARWVRARHEGRQA